MIKREWFLTAAASVACLVGAVALLMPQLLLESKGIAANPAANIWMREVGALLTAAGVVAFLVRHADNSPPLQAVFAGNIVLQLGLLPIEPLVYANGIITRLSGIIPNTMLHVVLAAGFAFYLVRMRRTASMS